MRERERATQAIGETKAKPAIQGHLTFLPRII